MNIVSHGPFVASSFSWQAHNGTYARTVIVKATFVLQPGIALIAPNQEDILGDDKFYDDDPRRSVRAPSDHVPYKPHAEVMLVGHAYATNNQPVRSLRSRLVVNNMDKTIDVWCDRKFRLQDAQLLEGRHFTKMPLSWERAARDPDLTNPVGKSFDDAPDAYGTITIPNLQPAGHFVSKRSDRFRPVSYAPISPMWPGRMHRLGRLSSSFLEGRWSEKHLPEGFDPSFFQSAPSDQFVQEIRPNERIVMEQLHPQHACLMTSLPGVVPRAVANRATGEQEEISLVADTLWIDSDRSLCCVVWRGRIGLRTRNEQGQISVWIDASTHTQAVGTENMSANETQDPTMTVIGSRAPFLEAALPFLAAQSSSSTDDRAIVGPFAHRPPETNDDGTTTIFVSLETISTNALPFESQQPYPPNRIVDTAGGLPHAHVPGPFANNRMDRVPEHRSIPAQINVAPPPMIGPLAKMEPAMELEKRACTLVATVPLHQEKPRQTEKASHDDTPPVRLSIEQTATVAAELSEGHIERPRVFDAHELGEPTWCENQSRWDDALKDEQKHGKSKLRNDYDTAYVKRVEGFRGAITVDDYACLVVAMQRSTLDATLAELRIQRPALMPIMRVWAKKIATDARIGKDVAATIRKTKRA